MKNIKKVLKTTNVLFLSLFFIGIGFQAFGEKDTSYEKKLISSSYQEIEDGKILIFSIGYDQPQKPVYMNYTVPRCMKPYDRYCAGFIKMNIEDYKEIFHAKYNISIKTVLEEDPKKEDGQDIYYEASGPISERTFKYTYKSYYKGQNIIQQVIIIKLKEGKAFVAVGAIIHPPGESLKFFSKTVENLVVNREDGVELDDLGEKRGTIYTIEDLQKIMD